ncbi:MAG: pilus assembly protein PilN, partial [Desulfobacteraceae bacterium]
MIRINLLPYRAARKKENIRIQVNVFIGSIVIALLLIWWINSFLAGRIDRLNTQIADTKDQVAKYKKIMDEIAEIKKKLSLLDRKIEVIKSLEADSKAPVENLDSLYHVLVEKKMWYTKI